MHRAKIVWSRLCSGVAGGSVCSLSTAARTPCRQVYDDDDDDVVIVSARRTPVCKSHRGGLKVKCNTLMFIYWNTRDVPIQCHLCLLRHRAETIIMWRVFFLCLLFIVYFWIKTLFGFCIWQDTLPDDLLAAVFQAVMQDAGVQASVIQDICVGQ